MESVDYRRISSQNLKEFLGSCARLIYQVGDDCDRVGSCLDNGPAILPGNSADRHQGLRRQFADLAKALQSDYRVWIVLAPRSENRTDGDVIDRGLVGDPQLFGIVGRNSNPSLSDHDARSLGREIVLPDVHPITTGSHAQISAIVKEQS